MQIFTNDSRVEWLSSLSLLIIFLFKKFYLLESKYAYQRPSLVYYTSIRSCSAQNEKARKQVNILQWTSLFPFSFSINNFYSE